MLLNILCTFRNKDYGTKEQNNEKVDLKAYQMFCRTISVCFAFRTVNKALISLHNAHHSAAAVLKTQAYSWAKQMDMPTHFCQFDLDSAKSSLKKHLMESDSWLGTLLYAALFTRVHLSVCQSWPLASVYKNNIAPTLGSVCARTLMLFQLHLCVNMHTVSRALHQHKSHWKQLSMILHAKTFVVQY